MRSWRILCEELKITVNDAQAFAMDQLERRGLRFCADFGTDNACEILSDLNQRRHDAELAEFDRELALHRSRICRTRIAMESR